ncbi:hypothetical protein [Rhodoplanes elegans]|uniref:hypothetical protein n=1 Tax=Rhodoplanes elegans TaxID=29408 RepID=UPI0011B93486|nr:hypothetical protein [Rhodoplanes elegans]
MKSTDEFFVVGCLPYSRTRIGFALPLFCHPSDRSLRTIQIVDEYTDLISRFDVVDGEIEGEICISDRRWCRVGGGALFCFMPETGAPQVGTLAQLESCLRGFARRNKDEVEINLQIFELIGTEQEKKEIRLEMKRRVISRGGIGAGRAFYERSSLLSVLWKMILDAAPNEDAAKRILQTRSRLIANVSSEGDLSLDLSALDPVDRANLDEVELIQRILNEFDFKASRSCEGEIRSIEGNEFSDNSAQILVLLKEVSKAARQEERLAMLLGALIGDRALAAFVLRSYKDRGKFANDVLDRLYRSVVQNKATSDEDVEYIVAEMISQMYSQAFPANRGVLIYYLAKYLSKWRIVRSAIGSLIKRRKSVYLSGYVPEIERFISEAENA